MRGIYWQTSDKFDFKLTQIIHSAALSMIMAANHAAGCNDFLRETQRYGTTGS